MLKSENLKRLILRSDSARWPATPTHPWTALTQRGLSSQILNQDLTVFWLNVCLGRPNLYPEVDYADQNPLSEALRERILKARVVRRQLQIVQFTVRVRRACNPGPLNPSITISTSVHLNSPELHACNHHSSARRDMMSHYTFIPL